MSNLLNRVFESAFDDEVHSLAVIDEQHRMNHAGFMFHTSGKVIGMVDANVDDFLLVTGDIHPHIQLLNFDFGAGDIDIVSYEDTTTSNDGTPITALLNTNRNSSITPLLTMFSAPTVTGVGTLLHTAWMPPVGTGIGQSASGISGGGNGEEWELKPNSKYMIRITNNSGSTIDYRYELRWYEPNF